MFEKRKKLLDQNLHKIVKILREKYHPEKIILYGSCASGQIHPNSDLDLLIIKKDVPERYWDRIKEVSPLLAQRTVGLDYIIWTPEEWEEKKCGEALQTAEKVFEIVTAAIAQP